MRVKPQKPPIDDKTIAQVHDYVNSLYGSACDEDYEYGAESRNLLNHSNCFHEALLVIGQDGEIICQHSPLFSSVFIPDSRNLWEIIWENREKVAGIAHSHPGTGIPFPSREDLTTFAALEAGLGKRLNWWITSKSDCILVNWQGPNTYDYSIPVNSLNEDKMVWLEELRRISNHF